MPDVELEIRPAGGGELAILRVSGDLDESAPAALRDAMTALLNGTGAGPPLILDLSHVTSCDSAGVGAIIAAYKRVVLAGGLLVIAAIPAELRQDFDRRKLDRLFRFYETAELAAEDLGRH